MKRQLSQPNKWLLTTALLAVLGTNYSLQTSSIEVARLQAGQFELASKGNLTPDGQARIAPNMSFVSKSDSVDKAEIQMTEAVSSLASESCESGDCKNVPAHADILLKLESDNKELMSRITELEAKLIVKAEVAEEAVDCNFAEEGKAETRAERKERRDCEKEALQAAKDEKEAELQDEREKKFEDALSKIQDKCGKDNMKCLTEKFSSLLKKYKGKKSLSKDFVSEQFKDVIGPALSKSLYNENATPEEMQVTQETLRELFNDFPSEYSHIQTATLTAIQKTAVSKAEIVTKGYQTAELMSKQNNPAAYLQKLNEVQTEQKSLEAMTNAYTATFYGSAAHTQNSDVSTYFKRTYLPTVQETFAKILSPTTTAETTKTTDQIVNERVTAILEGRETSTRTNHRGGGSSVGVNPLNQQKLSPSEQNLIPQPGSRGGSTRGGNTSTGSQMPASMPPPPPTSYMQFNM